MKIKSVFFVHQIVCPPMKCSSEISYQHNKHPAVKASLTQDGVLLEQGNQRALIPYANVSTINLQDDGDGQPS